MKIVYGRKSLWAGRDHRERRINGIYETHRGLRTPLSILIE
jgi:hypothetical protein